MLNQNYQFMERDNRFDIMKGFLIILVVLGHSLNIEFLDRSWDCPLFNAIYCFHMPVFIFISGYFFSSSLKKSFCEVLYTKLRRFVLPAICCSTVILLLQTIIKGVHQPFITNIVSVYISYWYLICIFILTLAYYIAIKYRRWGYFPVIICYIAGIVAYYKIPVVQILDCQVFRMFLCFGFGIIYNTHKSLFTFNRVIIFLMLSIAVIVINRYYNGFNLSEYSPIYRICDGLAWCMLMFAFLIKISSYVDNNKIKNHLIKAGQCSLSIYLVHLVIYNGLLYLELPISMGTYISLCLFIIIYALTWSLIYLFKRTVPSRFKFLIGL